MTGDTEIEPRLADWLESYRVAPPDTALYDRMASRVPEMRRKPRLPVVVAVLVAFLAGAGVSYARIAEIDTDAMAASMLSYGYASYTGYPDNAAEIP